jgi:hypothetical protein
MRRWWIAIGALIPVLFVTARYGQPSRSAPVLGANVPLRGPCLFVERPAGSVALPPVEAAEDPTRRDLGTALALGGLLPEQRNELASVLERVAERLENRAGPLALDLEDGTPEDELARLGESLLPVLTAARALAASHHQSGDGTLRVSLAAECPHPTEAHGFALWQGRSWSPEEQRARFLAWSWAAAVVLRAPDAAETVRLRDALRRRITGGESLVALAIDEVDLAGDHDSELDSIRASARRVARIARRAEASVSRMLEELAAGAPAGRRVPWFTLHQNELLVVPRLLGVAKADAFIAELERTIAVIGRSDQFVWQYRPTPLSR